DPLTLRAMNERWALFAALCVCSGCGGTAAPLPACSAAIPGSPTATVGPNGSSACTEVGPQAVTIAQAADLTVANYVTLGPAFTFTGAGPFPHGVDFVLPYTASKQKGDDGDVVVIAARQHAPAH